MVNKNLRGENMENKTESKERLIYGICNKLGMRGQTEFFYKWFSMSFPNESNSSYIGGWVERFQTGTPFTYMDSTRLNIYIDLVSEYKRG